MINPTIEKDTCSESRNKSSQSPDLFLQRVAFDLHAIVTNVIGFDDRARTVAEALLLINSSAEAIAPSDRPEFFGKVCDLLRTFFGIEPVSEAQAIEEVRMVIKLVFSDLFQDGGDAIDLAGKTIEGLLFKIDEAINALIHSEMACCFDVSAFVISLFERNAQLSRDDIRVRLSGCSDDLPGHITQAIDSFLTQFPKDLIPRKAFQGSLHSFVKTKAKKNDSGGGRARLTELKRFVSSLRSETIGIEDLHVIDYLLETVDAESAANLVGAHNPSLPHALIESKYNGCALVNSPFVRRVDRLAQSRFMIDSLSPCNFKAVIETLLRVVNGDISISDVKFRTGVGGSETDVPLRILSYLIPTLTIARRLLEQYGVSPRIELFTGQEGGIVCNEIDSKNVRANTDFVFQLAKAFVDQYYPEIKSAFSVVDDVKWDDPKMIIVLDYFENLVRNEMECNPGLREVVCELERRGEFYGKEAGKNNALLYAVSHVVSFCDIPTITKYLTGDASASRHIMSFGGGSEDKFDVIRNLIVTGFDVDAFNKFVSDKDHPELRITQDTILPALEARPTVLMKTGDIPPYFHVPEGSDIAVSELSGKPVDELTRLFGNRIHGALEIRNGGGVGRPQSGANSFLQGMSIIASVVPPADLASFMSMQLK